MENVTSTELVVDDVKRTSKVAIYDFSSDSQETIFSCLPMETNAQKLVAFNALNNPKQKSTDVINTEIVLIGFAVEAIEIADNITGELIICPRIVVMDNKGVSTQFVSEGIFGALKKLHSTFGLPQIKKGINIKFRQEPTKNGSMLTFDVVKLQ